MPITFSSPGLALTLFTAGPAPLDTETDIDIDPESGEPPGPIVVSRKPMKAEKDA